MGHRHLPDISIRVHGAMTPARCIELAKAAEAAGFAGVWFAENAFARGILPTATACALATERLQIGAGVFNPYSRHPTMMAMEIGAIDEIAQGRTTLGIGSGIASATGKLGYHRQKPLVALRDTLVIVRALLRGERVDHAGQAFSAQAVKLDYAPRADIPIFLAARGEQAVRLCGELADGLLISNMCSLAFAGRAVALMNAVRRAGGRDGDARAVQYLPCAVDRDRAKAIDAAKRAVAEMLPGFWNLGQRVSSAREALLAGTALTADELADATAKLRAGEDASAVLDERYVRAFALAGTADECIAGAARYAAAGVTELALTFAGASACEDIAAIGAALVRGAPAR